MGSTRVYINTFNSDGTYSGVYQEVTKYVSQVDPASVDADSLDFQLGVYLNSSVGITVNNRSGQFSDAGTASSIFNYKRANSIVRITWMDGDESPIVGFIKGRFKLSPEVTVFEGLLDDSALIEDATAESVQFQVLGYENLFDQETVPFAKLTNGDLASSIAYTCLNQSGINAVLTIDPANINLGTNLASDDVSKLENTSVQAALAEILKTGNSVLYIVDRVVYIADRTASADVKKTFYGQASNAGVENLINVANINNGMSRCFNYFFWDQSTEIEKDNSSIKKVRTRQKAISSDLFTDSLKRKTILFNLLQEFKDQKKQFDIVTPMTYDTLALNLLDKIKVDYPTVFNPTPGFHFPICGLAVCGNSDASPQGAVLPVGLWSLTIDSDDSWKILSKQSDMMLEQITFRVRKV